MASKPVGEARMSPMRRLWLEAYFGEAREDPVEAARRAGFKYPGRDGKMVEGRLARQIELRREEVKRRAEVQPNEVVTLLSKVARDPEHKDHVRALELLARIHGMVSEKFNVKVDKATLMKELDGMVEQLVATLDAQPKS